MTTTINPTDILRHLNYGEFLVMHQETSGADTKIWKVMVGEGYAALRVFKPEQAERFKFELQAMNLASAADIRVPEVLRTGLFRGHPCMLLKWIEGSSMLEACSDSASLSKLGRSFGRLHRVLHENTMRQDDSSLLHLDYHPLNVLVENSEIVGVIDWTNSDWGHPMQDVARTVSVLICSPILDRSDRKFARSARRIAREYLNGYGKRIDLKPFLLASVDHMEAELDYHVRENGLTEPKNARRLLARWRNFNS